MTDDEFGKLNRRLHEIENWVATMNQRLVVIESVVNDENRQVLMDGLASLTKMVNGDRDLGVGSLRQRIEEINRVVIGLVIANAFTLTLAIIALFK